MTVGNPSGGEELRWYDLPLYIGAGLAVGFGLVALVNIIGPGITGSLAGAEPKAYWYLSRAAGFVAYGLIWVSMALGLLISGRVSKLWPGGPTAVDLHEFTTISSLAFAGLHVLVLLGDRYIQYNLASLLVPGLSDYRAFWVVLGQLGLYLAIPVTASFYLRRRIGPKTWRTLHYATFGVFALVTAHGVGAGTDGGNPWVVAFYALAVLSLYALTVYRILASIKAPKEQRATTS